MSLREGYQYTCLLFVYFLAIIGDGNSIPDYPIPYVAC